MDSATGGRDKCRTLANPQGKPVDCGVFSTLGFADEGTQSIPTQLGDFMQHYPDVLMATVGFGVFVVVNALLGRYDVPGFATLASLFAFLLGLIICMLGIIGEYLWRIFDEVSRRPEAVIAEVH